MKKFVRVCYRRGSDNSLWLHLFASFQRDSTVYGAIPIEIYMNPDGDTAWVRVQHLTTRETMLRGYRITLEGWLPDSPIA